MPRMSNCRESVSTSTAPPGVPARSHAAAPVSEERLVVGWEPWHLGRVAGASVDREVLDVRPAGALRLVEVVAAVPGVGLRLAVVLDHRAHPVVVLEVEALVARRGEA